MRLHHLLSVLALTGGVTLFTASLPTPASAEPYGAVPPAITVSAPTVDEGGLVTFTGNGFIPFELVEIDVTYTSDVNASGRLGGLSGRPDGPGGSGRAEGIGGGQFMTAALPVPRAIVKTLNAEADGTWVTTIRLTEPGLAVVTAQGTLSDVTAVATVTIQDDTGNNGGSNTTGALARTGLDGRRLGWQVGGGVAAIVVGAGLVWFAVRRRRRSTATG